MEHLLCEKHSVAQALSTLDPHQHLGLTPKEVKPRGHGEGRKFK